MVRIVAAVAATVVAGSAGAADLSETESRWLQGAWPVIDHAKKLGLPMDIVVQPQPAPGAAPLAMAFVGGRCKMVLSMRGNPEAQATLDRIEPALLDATLELMAAHELGHCRRYLDGAWYRVPTGFVAAGAAPEGLPPDMKTAYADMKAVRREEGYGDLVGLAWIRQQRPLLYARLHRWLLEERSRDRVPGSHHDTLAWVKLAQGDAALAQGSIFSGAATVWAAGLVEPE